MKPIINITLVAFGFISFVSCSSDKQIEEWVKNNPDKILQSVMAHQQKQQEDNQPKPEMVKTYADALFKSSSPSLGKGPIEVAYFFDFNCGHCVKQSETMKDVLAKTDNVRIVYKNLPVLGPSSELAARAALAAGQQNKFHEFYTETYKIREKNPETLKKIAQSLKLDVKKWEADMKSEAVEAELNATRELATNMKIGGTPFVAIAPDKIFPGRVDQLLEIVQGL